MLKFQVNNRDNVEEIDVGKPKKRTSARKTGLRRSHILLKLKRMVNKTSPVRIRTTKNESGKRKDAVKIVTAPKTETKVAAKPAVKKASPKKPAK